MKSTRRRFIVGGGCAGIAASLSGCLRGSGNVVRIIRGVVRESDETDDSTESDGSIDAPFESDGSIAGPPESDVNIIDSASLGEPLIHDGMRYSMDIKTAKYSVEWENLGPSEDIHERTPREGALFVVPTIFVENIGETEKEPPRYTVGTQDIGFSRTFNLRYHDEQPSIVQDGRRPSSISSLYLDNQPVDIYPTEPGIFPGVSISGAVRRIFEMPADFEKSELRLVLRLSLGLDFLEWTG